MANSSTATPKNSKQMQQIINGLNQMRTEQRALSQKLVEIESDMNEHRLVIDVLKSVETERKCFRMVGGILIEQKVKDVVPDLEGNFDMLQKTVETFQSKIQEKAGQINEYVKTHNLASLLRSQNSAAQEQKSGTESTSTSDKQGSTSILV